VQAFYFEFVGNPRRNGEKTGLLGNGANNRTSMGEIALFGSDPDQLETGLFFVGSEVFSGENGFVSAKTRRYTFGSANPFNACIQPGGKPQTD
jgi:hypothetical protein